MMTETQTEIAIVGGGPTGAALALALAQSDVEVALIEARDPAAPPRARRVGARAALLGADTASVMVGLDT